MLVIQIKVINMLREWVSVCLPKQGKLAQPCISGSVLRELLTALQIVTCASVDMPWYITGLQVL